MRSFFRNPIRPHRRPKSCTTEFTFRSIFPMTEERFNNRTFPAGVAVTKKSPGKRGYSVFYDTAADNSTPEGWEASSYKTRSNTATENEPPLPGATDADSTSVAEEAIDPCQACMGKKRKHICGKKLYRGRWAKMWRERDEVELSGGAPKKNCPSSPLSVWSFPGQESPSPIAVAGGPAVLMRTSTRKPTPLFHKMKVHTQAPKVGAIAGQVPEKDVGVHLGDISDAQLGELVSEPRIIPTT